MEFGEREDQMEAKSEKSRGKKERASSGSQAVLGGR